MKSAADALSRLERPEKDEAFADKLFQPEIDALRSVAVTKGNQTEATDCWKAETIASIQRIFSETFDMLRAGTFYDAWCHLEQCEIALLGLQRHHVSDESDLHRIRYINQTVSQWQSLYPYKMFFSPEFLKRKVVCGICGSVVLPRNNCGHKKHNVYDGRLCIHRVEKAELLSISLVRNPVQKYSVGFLTDDKGQKIDHYDYGNVRFVADRVVSPWHGWRAIDMTRAITAEEVAHVNPSAPCPCCSGEEFGKCCTGKKRLVVPHLQIVFHVAPPPDFAELELRC